MNRGLSFLLGPASLLVLAGCSVSGGGTGGGGGGPFPGETIETVTVQPDFESDPVRQNVTLSAGQSRLYQVDISESVAQNNDVVYFDAMPENAAHVEGYLEVTAYNVSGNQATPLYISQTNEWFGHPDDPGLLSVQSSNEFVPSAIAGATPGCGGPCVVVPTPPGAGTAYIRVEALQSTVTFDLYVVATDFFDVSEPNNNTASSAELVTGGVADGTIELVGDTDWFETQGSVNKVTFHANNDVNLLANVCPLSSGSCRTISNGGSRTFSPAQAVRVEVYSDEAAERAGAAGKARYSIEFQ